MPRPKLRPQNRLPWPPTKSPTLPALWPGSWLQTSTSQVGPAKEGTGRTRWGEVTSGRLVSLQAVSSLWEMRLKSKVDLSFLIRNLYLHRVEGVPWDGILHEGF